MKEHWSETDLLGFPKETEQNIRNEENLFGVKVYKGGVPYLLQGTVSALLIKPNRTTLTINQNGSVSGNKASIAVPANAYGGDGNYTLSVVLTQNNQRTTLGMFFGTVRSSDI